MKLSAQTDWDGLVVFSNNPGPWDESEIYVDTVLAVESELIALRLALVTARPALKLLGNSDNYLDPTFNPAELALSVVATIDAAFGDPGEDER